MLFNKRIFWFTALAISMTGWNCSKPERKTIDDTRLITVTNGTSAANYSEYFFATSFVADSLGSAIFPARNGDILVLENKGKSILLRCSDELPDTLRLVADDSLLYLNGKLAGIELNGEKDMLPWLRQVKADELNGLQSLSISSGLADTCLPYLAGIAKKHPELNIMVTENARDTMNRDLFLLNRYFRPGLLFLNGPVPGNDTLKAWNSLESLVMITEDTVLPKTIPLLPELTELIFYVNSDSTSVESDFLLNNPQLEKLEWGAERGGMLPDLAVLPRLEELRLFVSDSLNISELVHPNDNLHSLGVYGDGISGLADIAGIKKLEWLALPANTAQAEFDSIPKSLPALSFLQLYGCEKIRDYSALSQAKNLRYLVITDTAGMDKSLNPLTSLKYLSLPVKYFSDTAKLRALQKALPQTVIAPNSGFCMGSGWILLLLPLAALMVFLQGRVRRLKRPGIE